MYDQNLKTERDVTQGLRNEESWRINTKMSLLPKFTHTFHKTSGVGAKAEHNKTVIKLVSKNKHFRP